MKRQTESAKLELEFFKYERAEEVYLEPSRLSTMGLFCDIVHVLLGSKYRSAED